MDASATITAETRAWSTALGSTAARRSRKNKLLEVDLSFKLRIDEVFPDAATYGMLI